MTHPPFDPADVEAVKRQIKTHMWISHDRVVDDPCIEGADEAVAGVLRVLAQRGRLVEPEPTYPPFAQAMKELRETCEFSFADYAPAATPPAEPVVTLSARAARLEATCAEYERLVDSICEKLSAKCAALRVQGGGT